MFKRFFILLGIPVLVGLSLTGLEPLMAQNDEAIKAAQEERKQRFKASGASMKALYREHLPAEDYQAIKAEATVLVKWAKDMPEAFPFGSDSDNDEAKPEIWTDFEGFKSLLINFSNTVTKNLLDYENIYFESLSNSITTSL